MLEKLNDPAFHETIGRTIIQTIKIGLAAAVFTVAQKALYSQSNALIESVHQDIAKVKQD